MQLGQIWKFRHFWLSLVKMDLSMRYRRSFLGVGWSLLHPLLMTIVFCLVFSVWQQDVNWRKTAPYFLTGLAVWEYFKSSILWGCASFFRAESYIRQCSLPLGIYTLRTVLGTTIHFLIAMTLSVTIIAALDPDNAVRTVGMLPYVLPAMLLMFVFCWAAGVLAAFVTVWFHDIQHLLEVLFQILFFLTPIIFPMALLQDRGLDLIRELNPAVLFLQLIRTPLLEGVAPSMALYQQAVILDVFAVGMAVATVAGMEKKLIFRL